MSGIVASGAADNSVIIWLTHPESPKQPWSIAAKLQVTLHAIHMQSNSLTTQVVAALYVTLSVIDQQTMYTVPTASQ